MTGNNKFDESLCSTDEAISILEISKEQLITIIENKEITDFVIVDDEYFFHLDDLLKLKRKLIKTE